LAYCYGRPASFGDTIYLIRRVCILILMRLPIVIS